MWRILKNLKVELPFDPAIPLLGIYPEEKKSFVEKDTCGRAQWLKPVIQHFGRPRWVDHEVKRSRPSWSTW